MILDEHFDSVVYRAKMRVHAVHVRPLRPHVAPDFLKGEFDLVHCGGIGEFLQHGLDAGEPG